MFGDFLDGNAVTYQQLGGAARGEQLDAALLQFARKLDDPGLIGNAEQRAAYGREQCNRLLVDSELFEFLAQACRD